MNTNFKHSIEKFLPIGGITPFSTIDYPNKISSVFFFQGCHLNCSYCHNGDFKTKKEKSYKLSEFIDFLKIRKNYIDAIVFSGGEPFIHVKELEIMAKAAKSYNFLIGIHTTGSFPEKLESLIEKVKISWVGIDLKGTKENYKSITNSNKNYYLKTVKSIKILTKHNIDFETRTTINHCLNNEKDLKNLLKEYSNLGIKSPVFQTLAEKGKKNVTINQSLLNFSKKHFVIIK